LNPVEKAYTHTENQIYRIKLTLLNHSMERNMPRTQIALLLGGILIANHAYALSPEATEGKALYPACNVCHDQANKPPLGPPMWGVQRQYKKNTPDKQDFVNAMTSFVKAPSMETAIHTEALSQMGLMPPMPLPDAFLNKISTYIFQENFPPPCDHWRIAVKKAKDSGNAEHAAKDQGQLNRFCK